MKKWTLIPFALLSVFLLISQVSCVKSPEEISAKAKEKDKEEEEEKTIAEIVEESERFDGLFTLFQDKKSGQVHMLIKKDQIDREYIYFSHTVDGVVEPGHFRGNFLENFVFSVRKHFDKIEFVGESTAYYFDENNALHRSAEANISPSVLAVAEIAAIDEEKGEFLIEADNLFLKENFSQVIPSPDPDEEDSDDSYKLGGLSEDKTKFVSIRNYPLNTDIVVEYVYEDPVPTAEVDPYFANPRNVSIKIQHSLLEMPQNDYKPRFDDPRVGYFLDRVTDLTSASVTPYRDHITRWGLKKENPGAELSEPIEPIVYWIENSTPMEMRDTIREAALSWNEAFESAGFKNAMVVKVQPDDADWDAGDIRYNVLRWTSSPNPPFGGYGPSFTNPRTGQILGADIMLEYVFMTNRLHMEKLFETAALDFSAEEKLQHAGMTCSMGHFMQYNNLFGKQVLATSGASTIEMERLVDEALRLLVLHEIGHTLGLNHNMKATQLHSIENIHNRKLTEGIGVSGSVMDYHSINLAPPGVEQGQYYDTKPGPYDHWAIEFGYSEALEDSKAEAQRLEKILSRSTEPALAFGNDADDMRAPGRHIDPRVMIGDNSGNAIGYAEDRLRLTYEVMNNIKDKYSIEGQSYHELRNAFLILTREQSTSARVVSRYIGGIYVNRSMVGQDGAKQPFTPVSLEDQRRAMNVLAKYVFSPEAFGTPKGLYNYLAMQRRGFDFYEENEDPKVHRRVQNIQNDILNHMLHRNVLARITDSRVYGNEYSLTAFLKDLTDAVFVADSGGNINTFRQNLQLEYVNRLIAIAGPGGESKYDYPSRSAALRNLNSIKMTLQDRPAGNEETMAHTEHVLFTIHRALEVKKS